MPKQHLTRSDLYEMQLYADAVNPAETRCIKVSKAAGYLSLC